MIEELIIYTDGACKGNPGAAAIGAVFYQGEKKIKEIAKPIGDATNNIAEYTALICALQEALVLKAQSVKVYTDSELMYKQINNEYKVKHPNIKNLFDQVKTLASGFKKFSINHVLREKNKEADRLASSVL